MTLEEINKELVKMFPDQFEDLDANELKELKKMQFPEGFAKLYQGKTPIDKITIGYFNFLRLQDLINENIWDAPGENLYELGFTIVGTSPDDQFYCVNMAQVNRANTNEVLLVDPDEEYAGLTAKEARQKMKLLNSSFEAFLSREFEFLKKAGKKKS